MILSEIIEYINKNVTSKSQLEGMRGMGLSLDELPESYRAKKQRTDSGIDYYICNRNETTRIKMYEKLVANVEKGSTNTAMKNAASKPVIHEKKQSSNIDGQHEKVCKACGTILQDNALFCHKCGEKYGETQQKNRNEDEEDWDKFFGRVKNALNDSIESFDEEEYSFEIPACEKDNNELNNFFDSGNGFSNNSISASNYEEKASVPDLVAENALLSPCPDTECTHGKEYYKPSSNFKFGNGKATLYNQRLYYIKQECGMSQNSVLCSKEDGSEKFCLIEKMDIGDDRAGDYYIVVNYYGIFIYNLNGFDGPEAGIPSDTDETKVLWYDFSGKFKKKYILGKDQTLIDVYIYGTKLYYITYSENEKKRKYHARYWDLSTGERDGIQAQAHKAITRILGNNNFILFYMDEESRAFRGDDSDNKKYDPQSGWCIAWKGDSKVYFLKKSFYPSNVVINDKYDEKQLPQIEFFDLKNNIVWVDNKCKEKNEFTTLIPYTLSNGKVEQSSQQKWCYPLIKREFGPIMNTKWYFDGEKMYIGDQYDSKFYAYNRLGEQHIWKGKLYEGLVSGFKGNEDFRVLGDYLYINEDTTLVQYLATLEQSEIQRHDLYDINTHTDNDN